MKVLFFKQEVRVPSNACSRRNLLPFLLFTRPYLHIRLIAKVSQRCIEYRSLTKKHEKENTKRQKKDKIKTKETRKTKKKKKTKREKEGKKETKKRKEKKINNTKGQKDKKAMPKFTDHFSKRGFP